MIDLSVIIVSWNVKEKLQGNLTSIFESRGNFSMEVFVVDNNSRDETVEMVNKKFEQVNLIANKENLGFAKANNQAIEQARGRFILLLNPDMRLFPETLKNMISFLDSRPEVGVAGCRLLDEKGEVVPHVRRFPRLSDQLAIVLKIPHFLPWVLNGYLQKNFDYSREAEVDSIRGSFFMIRKKTLEDLGKLDERYFIWFEEVDYCLRSWRGNWKVVYTPQASCLDYVGRSFSLLSKGVTQRYFQDSMLKFFRKWHPWWKYLVLWLAWKPVLFFFGVCRRS